MIAENAREDMRSRWPLIIDEIVNVVTLSLEKLMIYTDMCAINKIKIDHLPSMTIKIDKIK